MATIKRWWIWVWNNSTKLGGMLTIVSVLSFWFGLTTFLSNQKKHFVAAYYSGDSTAQHRLELDHLKTVQASDESTMVFHMHSDEDKFSSAFMPAHAYASSVPHRRDPQPLRSYYDSDSAFNEALKRKDRTR